MPSIDPNRSLYPYTETTLAALCNVPLQQIIYPLRSSKPKNHNWEIESIKTQTNGLIIGRRILASSVECLKILVDIWARSNMRNVWCLVGIELEDGFWQLSLKIQQLGTFRVGVTRLNAPTNRQDLKYRMLTKVKTSLRRVTHRWSLTNQWQYRARL